MVCIDNDFRLCLLTCCQRYQKHHLYFLFSHSDELNAERLSAFVVCANDQRFSPDTALLIRLYSSIYSEMSWALKEQLNSFECPH